MQATPVFSFWAKKPQEVMEALLTSDSGLTTELALQRLTSPPKIRTGFARDVSLFLSQFKNPLTILLTFALLLSAVLGEFTQSAIIFGILFFSAILSFFQERKASLAVEKLRLLVKSLVKVKRDNLLIKIHSEDVVEGDMLIFEAGDIVPCDALLISEVDLYVNESVLTGESFPSEKNIGVLAEDTPLSKRSNSLFKGTSIISGTATAVAVITGKETELGKIESELKLSGEETAFEKGVRQFGHMLMKVALIIAGLIIIINIWSGKNPFDSILFTLALALGLAPEMLPAIVTITLAAGARRLATKNVIVKKLSSIQNLGAIDVLCSDKTGTLTDGAVKIHSYVTAEGGAGEWIQMYAYLNAFYESGYPNPMDIAIREQSKTDISGYQKFDEVPYDFIRKRLSIVVTHEQKHIMITKGALSNITAVCRQVRLSDGSVVPIEDYTSRINGLYEQFSAKGLRTIGLSYKDVTDDPVIDKDDETNMIFAGFILLYDPPKKDIIEVITALKNKNVKLKIISGDNALIAAAIAAQIGLPSPNILSGKQLYDLNDEAILQKVEETDIFAEIDPSQKERIVRALQKKGHVVGYLGDGINDASALKTADVGISVNTAVDIAKESADMILLEKELIVLSDGISEGRKTYLNTLKYIFITISANFGNMFSMAIASIFLPFLPLLPAQILLTNFLSDIPSLAIASDSVDEEMLIKPRKWDIRLIRNFMVVFGLESSIFDLMTFGILLYGFHASAELFHTGWFVESVITEILILFVIRTRRTFTRSKPGTMLMTSSIIVILIVLLMPYIPVFTSFGLKPLPAKLLACIGVIALAYAFFGEITKKILFRKMNY